MDNTINLCSSGNCAYNQDGVCTYNGNILPCGRKED